MRKTGFILAGLIAFPCVTMAQTDDFDNFMNEELKSFDSFISDANRDFINFLRDPWKEFDSEKPVEKRVEPEPVKPIVYDEAAAPKDEKPICLKIEEILNLTSKEGKQKPTTKVNDADDLDFERPEAPAKKDKKPIVIIRDTVKVTPVQKPVTPKKEPAAPKEKPADIQKEKPVTPKQEPVDVPKVQQPATPVQHPVVQTPKPSAPSGPLHTAGSGRSKVTYLGQSFYFSDNLKGKCTLAGVTENKIADAYETLCKSEYKPLLKELRQAAAEMQMNDWGLYRLVEAVAKAFCSTDNEAVVMQQFIFNELGYKTKMARENGKSHMILFVATDCAVYGHPFFEKDGQRYYCMSLSKPCQFLMCQQDAASAKNKVSMVLKNAPDFTGSTTPSTHKNEKGNVSVSLDIPNSLMEFYKQYPQCDYRVYSTAPVNPEVERNLLNALRPYIQGKGEAEAANILIDFVQTGFKYATDDEQFGYEKPFFVEELFYYPYCDCEDRSILYSFLVRKLLGLDVVLLDYPDHIATAVCFNGNVNGDYVMVGNKKYTVCDPTYIGAPIGTTMPMYKNVAATVLKY